MFSREVVRTWVTFYKKHREVLGADLVHVRRPNMQVGRLKLFFLGSNAKKLDFI